MKWKNWHYPVENWVNCTDYTALYSLHCTVFTTLHCTNCTVLTTLHYHYSTVLYSLHFTVLTSLHCTHFTVCSDTLLIKEPKILSRDINESIFWIIFTLNNLELIYNVQIWICSYLNIHNLQKQTNFQNAQNLKRFIISYLGNNWLLID